jgi:hypothetical protein
MKKSKPHRTTCWRPKLEPELVPQPLWGISACNLLRPQSRWRAIRSIALERAGHRCEACTEISTPLYCHEQWLYDIRKSKVTLTGFRIVCKNCNRVVHIGLAYRRGELPEALSQLARVNAISEAQAKQMYARASVIWRSRSRKDWKVNVKPQILKLFPQLDVLVGIDTSTFASSWNKVPTIQL